VYIGVVAAFLSTIAIVLVKLSAAPESVGGRLLAPGRRFQLAGAAQAERRHVDIYALVGPGSDGKGFVPDAD
jgi:hypothetical protein